MSRRGDRGAMRRWGTRVAVVVGLVALGWLLRVTVLARDPVAVTVVVASRGRVESTVTNSKAGTIRARRRAGLSPEIGGRVAAILHREGDTVQAGDEIVRLDDTSQRAQLLLAQSGLEAARARHDQACIRAKQAARDLERYRGLESDRIVSEDLLDRLQSESETAEAACQAAAAEVETARARVAVAEAELRKTVLVAPFDGILAEVGLEVGEWVTPSPPMLPVPAVVDVLDPTSLYVSAPMDEVDSARIGVGQRARSTVDSHPGRSFPSRVVRVAPYVLDLEAQNRTVEIEVELDDESLARTLLPGTSADVEVVLDVRDDVLRVPTSTLLEGGRVFVVEEGRVAERHVETGLRNWDWTEIREGLQPGERVVSSLESADVRPGVAVTVDETADAS